MIWNWLVNKLGIIDILTYLRNINDKVNEIAKIQEDILDEVGLLRVDLAKKTNSVEIKKVLDDLDRTIRNIPKLIAIKHILGIR